MLSAAEYILKYLNTVFLYFVVPCVSLYLNLTDWYNEPFPAESLWQRNNNQEGSTEILYHDSWNLVIIQHLRFRGSHCSVFLYTKAYFSAYKAQQPVNFSPSEVLERLSRLDYGCWLLSSSLEHESVCYSQQKLKFTASIYWKFCWRDCCSTHWKLYLDLLSSPKWLPTHISGIQPIYDFMCQHFYSTVQICSCSQARTG